MIYNFILVKCNIGIHSFRICVNYCKIYVEKDLYLSCPIVFYPMFPQHVYLKYFHEW